MLIVFGLALAMPNVTACDVCGGMVNNGSGGLLYLIPKHTVGLNWQVAKFHSQRYEYADISDERFGRIEFNARFQVSKRFRLVTAIPFSNKQSVLGFQKQSLKGLGDITLAGQYDFVPNKATVDKFAQNLIFSLGLKLPTGTFDHEDANYKTINPYLQPGTGSTDMLASLIYAVQKERIGLSANLSFLGTTENPNQFRFGNQWQSELRCYAITKPFGQIKLVPSLGFRRDFKQADIDLGTVVPQSSTDVLNGMVGLDFFAKEVAISVQYQLPLVHLRANNLLQIQPQFTLGAFCFLNQRTQKVKMANTPTFQDVSPINSN